MSATEKGKMEVPVGGCTAGSPAVPSGRGGCGGRQDGMSPIGTAL